MYPFKKVLMLLSLFFLYTISYSQDKTQTIKISDHYNTYRDHAPIDYEPIKNYVRNKRIAAFGESSHGVFDMYVFNSKMAKYLMENGICKTIILEKPFAQLLEVNDYIHGANMEFKELMNHNGLTPPVRELIQWMRLYNESASEKNRLSFFGMDVNGSNRYGLKYLNKELKNHDLPIYMEVDSLMKMVEEGRKSLLDSFVNYTERSFIENNLEKNSVNTDSYKMAMAVLKNLKMSKEFNRASPFTITKKRDQFMFENASFLEDNFAPEGSTIFLWAHNGHIRKKGASFLYKPVGNFLQKTYGEKYMAIALDFRIGKAFALKEVTITPEDNSDTKFAGNFLKDNVGGVQFVTFNQDFKLLDGNTIEWPKTFKLHNYTINKGMAKYSKNDFDAIIILDRVTSIYDYKNSEYDN